jgi:hypothetical protein
MNAAARAVRQEGLKVTHDWYPVFYSNPNQGAYYAARHEEYQCRKCYARCMVSYASHRLGWQKPMKWFSVCKTIENDSQRAARLANAKPASVKRGSPC